MLIFDGDSKPMILDSIHGPTVADYFWVLDLAMMDYTLAPLTSLREDICSSLQIRINDFEFILPAKWSLLVYDQETSQLDVVEIRDTLGKEFTAFVCGPKKTQPTPAVVVATNYFVEHKNVGPLLNKHQMLCHPIGPEEWVNVSPSDTYNKYLKDRAVGDLIG